MKTTVSPKWICSIVTIYTYNLVKPIRYAKAGSPIKFGDTRNKGLTKTYISRDINTPF